MVGPAVPIVIPAVHPDDGLVALVGELFERGVARIVVVDDGSGGAYLPVFDRCRELGAQIITHDENLGKGAALRDAFISLIMGDEPIVGCVTADADGQHIADDILAVADEFIRLGGESLVLGVRDMTGENVPRRNRMRNRLINTILSLFAGFRVADSQTGLRGIPEPLMSRCLDLEGDHFEFETQMLLMCHHDTLVVEVPISTIFDDEVVQSTHYRPIVDSLRIIYVAVQTFLGFSAASLASTAVDLFLFWAFSQQLRDAGIAAWAIMATVLARICSASLNFAINRRRVFQAGGDTRGQVRRFMTVALVQMMLSALFVQALAPLFPRGTATLVKAVVDTMLFLANYQVQMRVVFAGDK